MTDLMTMRLRRAAVAAQIMMPDPMLMGRLSIGSFQQLIMNTESWLTGLANWPKRLYSKESMTFTKHAFDIPMTTRQLPALRAVLPSMKCFNTVFAIGIDLLMGALESVYCSGSYKLILQPIQTKSKSNRARGKETGRHEIIWVSKNFDMGHVEFFGKVVSITGTELTCASHGIFDLKNETFEITETLVAELVPKVGPSVAEFKDEVTRTVPLKPSPSISKKNRAKTKKSTGLSVSPIPVSPSEPTPSVPMVPEIPAPDLPKTLEFEVDAQLSTALYTNPDPSFQIKSMLGKNRQKCARVRLPHEIIKLYQ